MENMNVRQMDEILSLPESRLIEISKENFNRIVLIRMMAELEGCEERALLPWAMYLKLIQAQIFHANYRFTVTSSLTYEFEKKFRTSLNLNSDEWAIQMTINRDIYLDWMHDYPGLSDIFSFIFETEIANFRQVCRCFIEDYDDLIREGWITEGYSNVTDVHLITSETHNGGKNVLLVKTNGHPAFALKPRPGNLEAQISTFISDYVREHLDSPNWPLPHVIVAEDHFWTTWIRFRECCTLREAQACHYNSGVLTALSLALGIVDLNCENIIASGEYIIPIDLECALHHQRHSDKYGSALPEGSVLKNGLLTTVIHSDSGILSDSSGTAFLGLINENGLLHRAPENSYNLSYGNIDEARVWDCSSFFINGFRDCYLSIIENKPLFFDFIDKNKSSVNRYIRRTTSEYSEILEASLNPSLMGDPNSRYQYILTSLSQPGLSTEEPLICAEAQSIYNGEIPMFSSTPGTNTVTSFTLKSSSLITNVICGSEVTKTYIQGMSVDTLRKEIGLIEDNIAAVRNVYLRLKINIASPDCSPSLAEVYDGRSNELLSLLKKMHDDSNVIGFYGNAQGYYYGKMDASLATGVSGVLLGAKLIGLDDSLVSCIAEKVMLDICSDLEKGTGVFLGGAHVGFISTLLPLTFALDHKSVTIRKYFAASLLKVIIRQHTEVLKKFDYHNGASGILAVASLYAAMFDDPDWRSYSNRLYHDLLSTGTGNAETLYFPTPYRNSSHPDGILSGISHGQSGIIYSVALHGMLFPESRQHVYGILPRLIQIELNCFDDVQGGWPDLRSGAQLNACPSAWLHGAPGILVVLDFVSRNYALPALEHFRTRIDTRKVLERSIRHSFDTKEVGIVHGPAGILMAGRRLGIPVEDHLLGQYLRIAESAYRRDISESMTLLTGKIGDLILLKEMTDGNCIMPMFPHEYLNWS
ncbi:DUF4135 domain-containing protein (plasmid) [Klebsiella michiganensis]|uniref:DUF4135 domain-containing protein n=1 Tax=Klebsiella michiganensis TaxID=1134687 RepID=UPI002658DD98|nr:DUF4135 domain-containing protein [Klebsiella michiganensis]WKK01103.1 DUF4135 domain-containing protein [Klebsiella michiganensis]WKK03826.1 DUF4135 domain-containing protein [Klebsiella michiganensis]WKK06923.1 DUF4135 domain-containing protein [Klebsiella michiganensis]WKK07132.1 DUF4135 domain-containing protein [Klebsiella michiganensis]